MADARKLRVACMMMQRDEEDLLRTWLIYHGSLFGLENLYVFDNGSRSDAVISVLREFAKKGVTVDFDHNSPRDFEGKGNIIGSLIESLSGSYDFFIPLDCDEFFTLRTGAQAITCFPPAIHAALGDLAGETRALRVKAAFYNVLNHPEWFWCWDFQKTFFAGDSFQRMDHGYHQGVTKAGGELNTDFVYVHYHHKPYSTAIEHAKNKLCPYVDVENRSVLEEYMGANYHCKFVLLEGAESYNSRFVKPSGAHVPDFPLFLRRIGATVPFA